MQPHTEKQLWCCLSSLYTCVFYNIPRVRKETISKMLNNPHSLTCDVCLEPPFVCSPDNPPKIICRPRPFRPGSGGTHHPNVDFPKKGFCTGTKYGGLVRACARKSRGSPASRGLSATTSTFYRHTPFRVPMEHM